MKSPIKKDYGSNDCSISSNVLSPIKRDLKEWKNAWKDSTYTLNRDIVWGKGRICARAGFKFQKVMVVEGFALFF
jgi:hypothetical protein